MDDTAVVERLDHPAELTDVEVLAEHGEHRLLHQPFDDLTAVVVEGVELDLARRGGRQGTEV